MKKSTKKAEKVTKKNNNSRIKESVDCLVELHKLQGVLLEQLTRETNK
ncbi:MAG: hypothetical protein H8D47_00135 [Planctomycetes bacterium]|nr:hypothetical protein [Planctomycetota bacterium]MBL7107357.1 hypothetical protein [Phycisphaerae bacterium]